jgi:hypothetical protein
VIIVADKSAILEKVLMHLGYINSNLSVPQLLQLAFRQKPVNYINNPVNYVTTAEYQGINFVCCNFHLTNEEFLFHRYNSCNLDNYLSNIMLKKPGFRSGFL